MLDFERLQRTYTAARDTLLSMRVTEGHWIGELASSALSTATSISALTLMNRAGRHEPNDSDLIQRGVNWLVQRQNSDGGWGDTDRSHSNISTSMLVLAALELSGQTPLYPNQVQRAEAYVHSRGWIEGLRRRYGRDKTFAVPILTNCALAGLVDWRAVSPLPFELACFPQSVYRFLGLPVVSYAIPALVAIGQARFHHRPTTNPIWRWIRRRAVVPSLNVLHRMQPASGGYLEAVPLTSFVVMSLASMGRADHPVAVEGLRFIRESFRSEGSWPIDTNLATWLTSLSIYALEAGGEKLDQLNCWEWMLSCQHRARHPFTGAEPGGWGWTDLSGAVPDADDTPGALLAIDALLRTCSPRKSGEYGDFIAAGEQGVEWLLNLQNSDGGWPTFCRGWGKLPFDRSGADLTAHVLRALHRWRDRLSNERVRARIERAQKRGLRFLSRTQRADGSWIPLWFGNQDDPNEENPVYGTAKVLAAYRDLNLTNDLSARRGLQWLETAIRQDGGWGCAIGSAGEHASKRGDHPATSSVEETALAVESLLALEAPWNSRSLSAGLDWLMRAVETNRYLAPSPIGFYFAKLWYYEKLYPVVFTVSALGQALRTWRASGPRPTSPPSSID